MFIEDSDEVVRRLARLERENRRWRWAILALLVVVCSLGIFGGLRPRAAAARQDDRRADTAVDARALYEELHQKGHRAINLIDQTVKIGAAIPDPSTTVAVWSLRLLATDMYRCSSKGGPRTVEPEIYLSTATGPPDPERVRAFQEHLTRMKSWEERFGHLSKKGYLSQLDLLEIQARRIQAEAWLAREMNKPGDK